jgi:hypothetical protein
VAIQLLASSGTFFEPPKEIQDFEVVASELRTGMEKLLDVPVKEIVDVLHAFSRTVIHDEQVKKIEGIAFLSNWLRRDNLLRIVETNIGNADYLDSFVGEGRKLMRAFPRGLVCHWIAGNIPTLALFSLFQSMLAKNANILRVPEVSLSTVVPILRLFSSVDTDGLTGKDLLASVAIVYFPSGDEKANRLMSAHADARVVWGGREAVEAITGLPKSTHCEDVVFGPKYSFAVIDREALESENLSRYLRNLATDSVLFEQSACSSPHTVFIEADWKGVLRIADLFRKEFERLSRIMPKTEIEMGTASMIINKRAEYALSEDKTVVAPKENDWTILVDNALQLEEPVQSRTVFLKPVDSVLDTIPLITRNVQTIGNGILNDEKSKEFAKGVMCRGVARVVPPGQMHIYDSPWDGILLLSRLVNWDSLTLLQ